jgi:hypothetical protein
MPHRDDPGNRTTARTEGLRLTVSDRWPDSERLADLPLVTKRIHDPTETPAVFVADRGRLGRPRVNRPLHHARRIVDDVS